MQGDTYKTYRVQNNILYKTWIIQNTYCTKRVIYKTHAGDEQKRIENEYNIYKLHKIKYVKITYYQ